MCRLHSAQQSRIDRHANAQGEIDRVNELPMGALENRHKIDITFAPLERFLDAIEETQHLDVLVDGGVAIFQTDPNSDEMWPVVESFLAVADCFDLIAVDLEIEPCVDGFRKLAKKVDVRMMLFKSDIDAARASIAWMRKTIEKMSPNHFSEKSIAIQIRATMQEQKV